MQHTSHGKYGVPFVSVPVSVGAPKPLITDQQRKWGIIPRFKRVYRVSVDMTTRVFHCSCCLHERTGIPCRHIASVASTKGQLDHRVLIPGLGGFPPSAICAYWWTAYYYYGILGPDSPGYDRKLQKSLFQMNEQDNHGRGFLCTSQLDQVGIGVDAHVLELHRAPAIDRLLNYSQQELSRALFNMGGGANLGVAVPPPGLSQQSCLSQELLGAGGMSPGDDEDADDKENVMDLPGFHNEEPLVKWNRHNTPSRVVLSVEWNEVTNALDNSDKKDELLDKLREFLSHIAARAREGEGNKSDLTGHRVSSLPESS